MLLATRTLCGGMNLEKWPMKKYSGWRCRRLKSSDATRGASQRLPAQQSNDNVKSNGVMSARAIECIESAEEDRLGVTVLTEMVGPSLVVH